MALFDLIKQDNETPGLKPEKLLDTKDYVMSMVGRGTDMRDEKFRESYYGLRNALGAQNADKLLISILGFNKTANPKLSPEQRFDTWSNLMHNDEYVVDINKSFKNQAPTYGMRESVYSINQELTKRIADKKEEKPEMKQQVQSRLDQFIK